MCGRPTTTIGFERLYNPLARLERRLFLLNLTSSVPARPLNMTVIEAWRQANKPLSLGDTPLDGLRIAETEWPHAGALTPAGI